VSLGAVNTHTEIATMVTLASYESIQHCTGVVTAWFSFTVELGLYGHYKYTSAVSSASMCLATHAIGV